MTVKKLMIRFNICAIEIVQLLIVRILRKYISLLQYLPLSSLETTHLNDTISPLTTEDQSKNM